MMRTSIGVCKNRVLQVDKIRISKNQFVKSKNQKNLYEQVSLSEQELVLHKVVSLATYPIFLGHPTIVRDHKIELIAIHKS